MYDRDLLEKLHNALGEALLEKLKDGSATAADMNVVRAWLKDNGIESIPKANNPIGQLAERLPHFDDGEDENQLPVKH